MNRKSPETDSEPELMFKLGQVLNDETRVGKARKIIVSYLLSSSEPLSLNYIFEDSGHPYAKGTFIEASHSLFEYGVLDRNAVKHTPMLEIRRLKLNPWHLRILKRYRHLLE